MVKIKKLLRLKDTKPSSDVNDGFNWLFIQRFRRLLLVMFPHWYSQTMMLFGFLLVLSFVDQIVTYFTGIISSEYLVILSAKNSVHDFLLLSLKSVAIVLGKALIFSTVSYTSDVLYIAWRGLLTRHLHSKYFAGITYYFVNVLQSAVDNADQRITQDVNKLCQAFGKVFAKLIMAPFIIAYYTYKTYLNNGIFGPIAIYVYFVVGALVNKLIMSPVVKLVVEQEKREGNFRFKHMAIRSNAESVGFFNSGALENVLTNEQLDRLLVTQEKLILRQFLLTFATNAFAYFGSILSYLVVAIAIFYLHSYDDVSAPQMAGIVSQNAFVCMYLVHAFSTLVELARQVTDIAGTTHRVGLLLECMDEHGAESKSHNSSSRQSSSPSGSEQMIDDAQNNILADDRLILVDQSTSSMEQPLQSPLAVEFHNVNFSVTSSNEFLMTGLSFQIKMGQCLLITGASSSGKTSILRILRGLWRISGGAVKIREQFVDRGSSAWNGCLFLPQKSYLPSGSLRQQVVYPFNSSFCRRRADDDKNVIEALETVELSHLQMRTGSLDAELEENWQDMLSPGEAQRLSFARLFYHRPSIAFLDETTSSLDQELERRLYEEMRRRGLTYVSVGHRDSLRRFHDVCLHLHGNGSCRVQPLDSSLNSLASSRTRLD